MFTFTNCLNSMPISRASSQENNITDIHSSMSIVSEESYHIYSLAQSLHLHLTICTHILTPNYSKIYFFSSLSAFKLILMKDLLLLRSQVFLELYNAMSALCKKIWMLGLDHFLNQRDHNSNNMIDKSTLLIYHHKCFI